jgi:hypothetical protein
MNIVIIKPSDFALAFALNAIANMESVPGRCETELP